MGGETPIDGDGVLVALADVGLDFTPERGLALLQELALVGRSRPLVGRYSEPAAGDVVVSWSYSERPMRGIPPFATEALGPEERAPGAAPEAAPTPRTRSGTYQVIFEEGVVAPVTGPAVDLNTGKEVWSKEVHDPEYRGPYPP